MRVLFLISRYIHVALTFCLLLGWSCKPICLSARRGSDNVESMDAILLGILEMEQHNKEQAEKHVSPLTEMGESPNL